jgi:type III secretion protein N (ATPase)
MTSIADLAEHLEATLGASASIERYGKVIEAVGTLVKVGGLDAQMGELCELRRPDGTLMQRAEVVGITRQYALLAPFGSMTGLSRSTRVRSTNSSAVVPISNTRCPANASTTRGASAMSPADSGKLPPGATT